MAEGRVLDLALAFVLGALISPGLLIWLGERAYRHSVQRANREIEQERRGKRVPRVHNWHG
jgi:hypothetical protein